MQTITMLKSILICLAALVLVDAVAMGGEYRHAVIQQLINFVQYLVALDWRGFVNYGT